MLLHITEYTQDTADRTLTPLIILHGMFGAGDNWTGIARELGTERAVWTLDLPGHGNSYNTTHPAAGERIFKYTAMAARVAETLGALADQLSSQSPKNFVVCGHSMGGKVAMAMALLYPQLLAGLIVIDIAPTIYDAAEFHGAELAMLAAFDPISLTSRLEADSRLKEWIPEAPMRAFLGKNLRSRAEGGFEWKFDAQAIREGYGDIADWPASLRAATGLKWSGPAVFIYGQLSPYIVLDRDQAEIQTLFPNAYLAEVENAWHWVHVDNKSGFLRQVRAFLSKLHK